MRRVNDALRSRLRREWKGGIGDSLPWGEKQRGWMGRAVLTAPELLLLDEPLASLDIPRKRELLPYLPRLTRENNSPMFYCSQSTG
ncbi:molybdate ABC transporter ATPase [Escherichia coli]|uniref:hypothetical protein n=1 Tax=Escherichia coli TaxID=562 RepID=UPI0010C303A5|nr:molybdate ABC transporter ATPase [Escherichia coli]